jgi:hypothetical protein
LIASLPTCLMVLLCVVLTLVKIRNSILYHEMIFNHVGFCRWT